MTIDDASSIVNYHPQGMFQIVFIASSISYPIFIRDVLGDGGIGDFTANGWQPFYTGSPGGFTTRGGEAALGDSMHITAFPNATLDFQFFGELTRSIPLISLL